MLPSPSPSPSPTATPLSADALAPGRLAGPVHGLVP